MRQHKINIDALNLIRKDIKTHSPHPSLVNIIAVTKTFNFTSIISAKKNQIAHIGENKIQEFLLKTKEQSNLLDNIETHLIGHLQSNKVNKATNLFDVIETVDSLKIAHKINRAAAKQEKHQSIFIQINIGSDPNKYGFQLDNIYQHIETIEKLKHIHLLGLMTILPIHTNSTHTQPLFNKMKQIQTKTLNNISPTCKFLSMGMSQDYIYALKEGATHLRIGTKLYGPRH